MINDFLRSRIKRRFALLKNESPNYSLRMHAKSLGVSPGAYSEFLAGRRRFSDRKVIDIANRLPLDSNEEKLLSLILRPNRHVLPDETFAMIKEWHHFAILSYLELNDAGSTIAEISKALAISSSLAKDSVDRMLKLNLILRDSEGTFSATGLSYFTTDDIPSPIIREAHRDGLKLGIRAIDEVPTTQRDITALTFSGSSKQMAKAKKEIRRCLDRVSQIMGHPDKDQVYRLSIQLFPVLKNEEKS